MKKGSFAMQRLALYAASGVNYYAKVNNAIFSKTPK
jgi:hypothetical protein